MLKVLHGKSQWVIVTEPNWGNKMILKGRKKIILKL